MTADISTDRKNFSDNKIFTTITLALAAITLCFALLSLVFGNRLATLRTHYLETEKETASLEAASMEDLEIAHKTVLANLGTVQKSLDAEKSAANKLRKQLSGVMKDLKNTKADLAKANQTIAKLMSTQATPMAAPSAAEPLSSDAAAPITKETTGDSPPTSPPAPPPSD